MRAWSIAVSSADRRSSNWPTASVGWRQPPETFGTAGAQRPRAEVKSVWSLSNASAVRPHEDPRPTQPPSEPNWRKVTLVLVAIAILVALAIAFGEIFR